jgi:hypothetical protein
MATDANLVLASTTTGDGSTAFTSVDLLTGSQRGGIMWARVEVTGATTVSTSPIVLTFTIEHSSNNSTWYTHTSGADQTITVPNGSNQVPSGISIAWIPIATEKRYIRLKPSSTGGTTSTLNMNAYITNSHPQ